MCCIRIYTPTWESRVIIVRLHVHYHDVAPNPDTGSVSDTSTPSNPPWNLDTAFEHKSFKVKSSFNPPGPYQLEYVFDKIISDLLNTELDPPKQKNLSKGEFAAIKSLKNNDSIVIKKADKGSAVVVLDKNYYIQEGSRQLSDTQFYKQIPEDLTDLHVHKVNLAVNDLLDHGQITQKTADYLLYDINRTPKFYLLPKIHKSLTAPKGRGIVSGNGSPTEEYHDVWIFSYHH